MAELKFGVVVFPGSNCDMDTEHVLKKVLGQDVVMLWHMDNDLQDVDAIILPGGFSFGDYLRTGAIAKFSPIMDSAIEFANSGKPVIGICNGFQILVECGLLPGALVTNSGSQFISEDVYITPEGNGSAFTNALEESSALKMPIAHHSGSYYADDDTIKSLERNGQIIFRYCDKNGEITKDSNPNGSVNNIAGIINEAGNVMGLMPHPERAAEEILGSADGIGIFNSLISHLKA